jgi:hypothetical protein
MKRRTLKNVDVVRIGAEHVEIDNRAKTVTVRIAKRDAVNTWRYCDAFGMSVADLLRNRDPGGGECAAELMKTRFMNRWELASCCLDSADFAINHAVGCPPATKAEFWGGVAGITHGMSDAGAWTFRRGAEMAAVGQYVLARQLFERCRRIER